MTEVVLTIYRNIIEQVMLIEKEKKEISSKILFTRNEKKRMKLIFMFLSRDLDKHELLEYAAILAFNNQEVTVIHNLQQLYRQCREEELMEKIRMEIQHTEQFLFVINNGIKYAHTLSFSERRMIQEIVKYVTEQAKFFQ